MSTCYWTQNSYNWIYIRHVQMIIQLKFNNLIIRRIKQMNGVLISKKSMYVIMLIIIILMFWFMHISAKGEEKTADSKRAYYHELEKRYENVVRKTLEIKGYSNAGITITARIETDGSRSFNTKIHHFKFNKMDDDEKNNLLEEISQISFTDAESIVTYELF